MMLKALFISEMPADTAFCDPFSMIANWFFSVINTLKGAFKSFNGHLGQRDFTFTNGHTTH